jgi:hypothetical protein
MNQKKRAFGSFFCVRYLIATLSKKNLCLKCPLNRINTQTEGSDCYYMHYNYQSVIHSGNLL